MNIIEKQEWDESMNEPSRKQLAEAINAMRCELGKPETDFIRNKANYARLVSCYVQEREEYERAVRLGTRMAEWWLGQSDTFYAWELLSRHVSWNDYLKMKEAEFERALEAARNINQTIKEEYKMAKDKGKKNKSNPKKKDQTVPEPTAAADDSMPEPQDEGTQAAMTDRRAVEILFAVTMKEEDRPKMEDFTDLQCSAELKENIGLLAPEDGKTVLEQFPEDGEAAWSHFQALRADLAGEKTKEEKKAGKAAGKAKKNKAPAAEKPPKEKKTKEPKKFKGPVDHSTSNKAQVYIAWKAGETDVEKLHKKVNEGVGKSTIKAWIGQWKNGKNLPAIAKEKAA